MCDFFWQRTDIGGGGGADQQGGDLSDIIRSVNTGPPSSSSSPGLNAAPDVFAWQFPLTSLDDFAAGCGERSLRDPLLHELTGTSIFGGCPEKPSDIGGGLFSRGFQIPQARPSPPGDIRPMPPPMAGSSGDVVKVEHGVQITSPRTPAGVKRRKSQAKKVVCIPAPAAASSRPSGEVVPSDLWAWRKYGQKPIKGSPYPRGYYRCSSSKGCSARKQVERSRTDPNMLVITYTSEHNHPWPTQRNALAGSTRSQPSKNINAGDTAMKNSLQNQRLKEEPNETTSVKEAVENSTRMTANDRLFDQGLFYNDPMLGADLSQSADFFACLAQLEPDPNLIFSGSGFIGDIPDEDTKESCKELDTFINMFDWGGCSFDHQDQPKV